jgi:transglutaminase-like putative cysteine protease
MVTVMDLPMRHFVQRSALSLTVLLLAGTLLLPAQTEGPPATKHLEITGRQRVRIVYEFNARWPRGEGAAVFYLPVPADTGTQTIEQFSSSLRGHLETDDSDSLRQIRYGRLSHDRGDDRDLRWRVEIVGVFQRRQLVDGPPDASSPPVHAPAPGAFLASTESIDWKAGRFQDWLDRTGLRRGKDEAAVDYAGRVYSYLRENGEYSYPPETAWTASAGVRRLATDCGGFSLIFTAACRANRIPARLLVGQWFKTRGSGEGTELTGRQAHVIAEFFDPRIGWIPEDISSTFLHTRGFADLNFFGRDPGYFFAWHTDTDFHFAVPGKSDEHVQWIQNPAPWFDDDAESAAESASHAWVFEPLGAAATADATDPAP